MTSIMNNKYNIKETHNVSEASSFEDRITSITSKRHITCQKPLRLKIEKLNPV